MSKNYLDEKFFNYIRKISYENKFKNLNQATKNEILNLTKRINKFQNIHIKKNCINKINYIVCYFHSGIDLSIKSTDKGVGAKHIDTSIINYKKVLEFSIMRSLKCNSKGIVLLLSDGSLNIEIKNKNFYHIILQLKKNEVMFTRVKLFNALIKSNFFIKPVVFLDSDAFLSADINNIFKLNFDIGLTYRKPTLMLINEGVIYVKNGKKVSNFFKKYLNIFENLLNDRFIKNYFPNLKLWRGGQLSLNIINNSYNDITNVQDVRLIEGNKLYYLPCDPFNFTPDNLNYDQNTAFITHLKGNTKNLKIFKE